MNSNEDEDVNVNLPPAPFPNEIAPPAALNFDPPAHLPLFKGGRKKILADKVTAVVSVGLMNDETESQLEKFAIALGLQASDATNDITSQFTAAFEPIKQRMEKSFVVTDSDLQEIEALKRKYNIGNLKMSGNAELFRAIYLVESKHQFPEPLSVSVFLDAGESCYFTVPTTWYQTRVHTHGYAGASVSLPTGLRGVRFRFGEYTPNRTEEITPLSTGTLYVTSKRILFNGVQRSTAIPLKKIVNGHMYSDSVKIEKSSGKPDLFAMNVAQARFVLSLIGALRS